MADDLRETEARLRQLAALIDQYLKTVNPNLGFAAIVFEFNRPGMSNYISNADRPTMIMGLRETLKRLEGNEDIPAVEGEA